MVWCSMVFLTYGIVFRSVPRIIINLDATGQQPCVPCLGQQPCTVRRCAVVTIRRGFTATVAMVWCSMVFLPYRIVLRSVPPIIINLDATGHGQQPCTVRLAVGGCDYQTGFYRHRRYGVLHMAPWYFAQPSVTDDSTGGLR